MKTSIPLTLTILICAFIFAVNAQARTADSAAGPADTIYVNGKIYTVNDGQPWVDALAIKDGRFFEVGSNADVRAVAGDETVVVDLAGKMVMPGLIDSHVHPLGVANGWANLRLKNATDADAILAEVQAYAEANPELPMIRGEAWNLGVFEGDSPKKELLDAIDSQRPIYLQSQTGHSAWANSKALEMAGITKDTPNGGPFVFDTDPETGEPSGTVREFAMGAVERVLPPTDPNRYTPALRRVLDEFTEHGFTTLKCAEGTRDWISGAVALDVQGGLQTRLFPCWEWRSHYTPHTEEEQDQLPFGWAEYQTDLIYPRYVKMFYDGGPDSYTALLLEDYVSRPGFKGQSNQPKEVFLEVITEFNATGIGVLVHVIGDGGARELVDIFTEVRRRNGDNGVPLHFSHAWMAVPEDIDRLSRIDDVCIDFSPALSYPAPEIEGSMAPPIGDDRYRRFFSVRSAFETGIPVGFGSDWASSLIPNPNGFHQMQSWVTRRNPDGSSSRTLNADQKITLEQAVRGFTLGGAECLGFGWHERLGSIGEGKLADFIVVDRNIFEIPIDELHQTKVLQTILGGEVVFDRADEIENLDVVRIEITNPELQNAVDEAALNLLVSSQLGLGGKKCCGFTPKVVAGAADAPGEVNAAFGALRDQGYRHARPARAIEWERTSSTYWIQWTLKGDDAVLWAYDPEDKRAVEILRVREE